ncbi:hypothetical protein SLA2020_244160 [Shorea laevis]
MEFQANGSAPKPLKFLIYGRTGWIGGMLGKVCQSQGIDFHYGSGRLENRASLEADFAAVKPTHVFNAAGLSGRPNADWFESHKLETIRTNVVGILQLADVSRENGSLLIHFGSACLFNYDADHPIGSGIGFTEEDTPNFCRSFYAKTRAMVEELMVNYENLCILRVRMPISSDLFNHRNLVFKLTQYKKIINVPNSISVLDELIPIAVEVAKKNLTGIWNLTNPGVISHNELLEMYRDYVDPNFTWENFTIEEQDTILVAPRCNNEMDVTKLKKEFPYLLSAKESLIKYVFEPNKKIAAA